MSTDIAGRDPELGGLFPIASVDLQLLHLRLERAARDSDLLDIAYRTIDTPVGELLLAATPAGLVRVAYASQDFDAVLADLATRISPRVLRSHPPLDAAAREVGEYFAGTRTRFDLPLDLSLTAGFRRQVIEQLREIGYGHRQSYAAIAAAVGSPRAVRAVGSACGHNPLPVVIPCHRVVRADGSIGQYVGGVNAKTTLLSLEAA
ncbi:methylated-DNA--[protein]-cysteine S-methyltransferase [Mycobacterium decipiens]|uniref:methylated-DNA--[protein]-cysteine S-methyltransferase n=1 Tax=Mycobacterium decipiens TaxID=1430326 RepID=A0A1X2LU01_9MYCO|nr:methylated-DNA--[protein]-cysteine S-methyltransferase [Mycobacterium decipiens]OSC40328.1 cysteine methyltransferase [Mycobacterium decipiens]